MSLEGYPSHSNIASIISKENNFNEIGKKQKRRPSADGKISLEIDNF